MHVILKYPVIVNMKNCLLEVKFNKVHVKCMSLVRFVTQITRYVSRYLYANGTWDSGDIKYLTFAPGHKDLDILKVFLT